MNTSDPRAARLALNEHAARQRNESTRERAAERGELEPTFRCECADPACHEALEITLAEYQVVRTHPAQFVVAPAHVDGRAEHVLSESPRYCLVEKLGHAAKIASELDEDLPAR